MTDWQKQRIKEIACHYGICSQKEKAVEECAELILAIKKHDGTKVKNTDEVLNRLTDIAGEIADVLIMCEQIAYLYGIEDVVKGQIDFKIVRQLERIAKGE